jgi:hypothetical protein
MGGLKARLVSDLVGADHCALAQFGDCFEDGGLADDELLLVRLVEGFSAGEGGDRVEDDLKEGGVKEMVREGGERGG